MLFGFRGIRLFQVILALIALAMGIGCALALKAASDDRAILPLVIAILLGIIFLWSFATAVRIPTSFVAVGDDRTRIRFAGFVDTIVLNSDITGVRLVKHSWLGGIGIRTDLRGTVGLITSPGLVAEMDLRTPIRVWAIPRLWRLRATRLRVSIRNPQKLVDRFGGPTTAAPTRATKAPRTAKRARR
jgi:hypothetical protein